MHCHVTAACAGNKDLKVEQFMIFRKQDPPKPQTETEWNNALAAWTGGP
jgi:hypothetical protein